MLPPFVIRMGDHTGMYTNMLSVTKGEGDAKLRMNEEQGESDIILTVFEI